MEILRHAVLGSEARRTFRSGPYGRKQKMNKEKLLMLPRWKLVKGKQDDGHRAAKTGKTSWGTRLWLKTRLPCAPSDFLLLVS